MRKAVTATENHNQKSIPSIRPAPPNLNLNLLLVFSDDLIPVYTSQQTSASRVAQALYALKLHTSSGIPGFLEDRTFAPPFGGTPLGSWTEPWGADMFPGGSLDVVGEGVPLYSARTKAYKRPSAGNRPEFDT